MQRHGDFFPDDPRTLDELLEQMARRMAAMRRLLASMSPEQRAELQALAEQIMQDMDLAFEVDRLGANLADAFPEMPWGEPAHGRAARTPMPMSATVDAMERLLDYEDLDRSMRGGVRGRRRSTTSTRTSSAARWARTRSATCAGSRRSSARWSRPAWSRARGGRLRGHAARRPQDGRARAGRRCSSSCGATARARTTPARPAAWPSPPGPRGRGGSATRVRSPCSDGLQRGRAPGRGSAPSGCAPTTSSWSRPSSAPRRPRRCCWTCRSRCRCAAIASRRRRWRWRCTR